MRTNEEECDINKFMSSVIIDVNTGFGPRSGLLAARTAPFGIEGE